MSNDLAIYVPALNAYMNPNVDQRCKSWNQVIFYFFKMNIDGYFSKLHDLAETFNNAKHPSYFRIYASAVDKYFAMVKMSDESFADAGFRPELDYTIDDGELRLSFKVFRRWLFMHGDEHLINAYELIEQIYQLYMRYREDMIGRNRCPTHWTIMARIDSFTTKMQPHVNNSKNKNKFLVMDEQPQVFCIFKGNQKQLQARFKKSEKDHRIYNEYQQARKKSKKSSRNTTELDATAPPDPKYDYSEIIPICESILPTTDDEIEAIIKYITNTRLTPYRKKQVGTLNEEGEQIKLTQTKYNVKVSKSHILIDPNRGYTVDLLVSDIQKVFTRIQYGKKTAMVPIKCSIKEPFVDIQLFEETDGCKIDEDQVVAMNRNDDFEDTITVFPQETFSVDEEESEESESEAEEGESEAENTDGRTDIDMSTGAEYDTNNEEERYNSDTVQQKTPRNNKIPRREPPSTTQSVKASKPRSKKTKKNLSQSFDNVDDDL